MALTTRRLLASAVVVVALVAGVVLFADSPAPNRVTPFAGDGAPYAAADVERGRYLAIAGNCASCHTTTGKGFMAGGVAFETPFGRLYS
ncbi:MAG: cytochrome c, partial [Myxococcota bacterium]